MNKYDLEKSIDNEGGHKNMTENYDADTNNEKNRNHKELLSTKRKLVQLVKDYQSSHFVFTQPGVSESIRNSKKGEYINAEYKSGTDEFMFRFEVQGTGYEGRSERIEGINVGKSLRIVREPDNEYNENTLNVLDEHGKSLGNVPADIANVISPLMDADAAELDSAEVTYVEPLSKRGKRAKKAILYAEINGRIRNLSFNITDGSIICILGGDQIWGWFQHLRVLKCDIPLQKSLLIFELYNRWMQEYENDSLDYLGLDNLDVEVNAARKKMISAKKEGYDYSRKIEASNLFDYLSGMIEAEPERYGELQKYITDIDPGDDAETIKTIFENLALDEDNYYWIDQTRVTSAEWEEESSDGFNHWYEIMELYSPNTALPFDLADEDIVCIFGFDKFEAFVDLSYGC